MSLPNTASPILSAIFGRCPRCGDGRLFSGYLKVADSCENCGLDFSGHDSADGPVVPIMLIVGFAVAGGALWLEFSQQPPIWLHLVIWLPVVLILSFGLLRPFKAFFIGAQFKYRAVDDEFPKGGA